MKRAKYTVGGEVFATKKAIEARIRSITAKLGEIANDEYAFVIDLFSRHPSVDEKIGCGVARIVVGLAEPYNTHCFFIERTDGTRIDVSWRECLAPSVAIDWFRASCRTAVVDQVQAVKSAVFVARSSLTCPITGDTVDRSSCHVDHAPPWPFVAIVDAFIAERALDPAAVDYDEAGTQSRFTDQALADDFAQFHRERAVLRVVSRKANLSALRRSP